MAARGILLAQLVLGLSLASGAGAQEFADTQLALNKVLFSKEDVAARQRLAERQRVDALDRQAQQQAALLQQQAVSVERLGGELRQIRDERAVIELAQAFEMAVAGGRWPLARALLAESVTVDLEGRAGTPAGQLSAERFVGALPASLARGGVLPRSNQRVRFEGERAILTSDGFAWSRAQGAAGRRDGQFEYGFVRTTDGWRIDSLIFRPTAL